MDLLRARNPATAPHAPLARPPASRVVLNIRVLTRIWADDRCLSLGELVRPDDDVIIAPHARGLGLPPASLPGREVVDRSAVADGLHRLWPGQLSGVLVVHWLVPQS